MIDVLNKLPLRGDLKIITRDSQSHGILKIWQQKNVITYVGVESLVGLMAPNVALGGSYQLEHQIKSMRFGIDNTTPQPTDTDLASEAVVGPDPVRIELTDSERLIGAPGTVEFVATLGAGDGNGVTYREAGLFTRGDDDDPLLVTPGTEVMFSRQVYPDQIKTGAVVLEFRWRITFTV